MNVQLQLRSSNTFFEIWTYRLEWNVQIVIKSNMTLSQRTTTSNRHFQTIQKEFFFSLYISQRKTFQVTKLNSTFKANALNTTICHLYSLVHHSVLSKVNKINSNFTYDFDSIIYSYVFFFFFLVSGKFWLRISYVYLRHSSKRCHPTLPDTRISTMIFT